MTSGAVIVRRLLRLPMTVKAGRVADGRGLESSGGRLKVVRETARRHRRYGLSLVTDGAVVIFLSALILNDGRAANGMRRLVSFVESGGGEHVLMFVVRKDGVELARLRGFGERETRAVARRDFGVTDGADDGARAFEKLRAMTADA